MSVVSRKIFSSFTLILYSRCCSSSSSHPFSSRSFVFLPFRSLSFSCSLFSSTMPGNRQRTGSKEQRWIEKSSLNRPSSSSTTVDGTSTEAAEAVTNGLTKLSIAENSGQLSDSDQSLQCGSVGLANHVTLQGQKAVWKPKSYGTVSGGTPSEVEKEPAVQVVGAIQGNVGHKASSEVNNAVLSKLFKGNLLESFTVDNTTYSQAQIRATFYPKFENEKSDHEIRMRDDRNGIKRLGYFGGLTKAFRISFMYAGHEGGAYAKNSFGNIYTAVGVFVLGRTFCEAWGTQAAKKQAEFNEYLERNHMCISMELVTAVLGDHGQRPREDYEKSKNNNALGIKLLEYLGLDAIKHIPGNPEMGDFQKLNWL